ncbi:MAG: hypothetical protein AB1643_00400 [Patescibacteria group bacterium]
MHPLFEAHLERKTFDHGYLMLGDFSVSLSYVMEAAKVILDPPAGRLDIHPDFFHFRFGSFGIDNSREIIYKASQKPLLGRAKVFIIETNSFTIESANALLKIMEEPTKNTFFFIIASARENIIPTLCSRLTIINNFISDIKIGGEERKIYEKFFSDLPTKRINLIKSFEKDRQRAIKFLNGLEIFLSEELIRKKNISISEALKEIARTRGLILSRAASVKMIMEHLALSLPQM